MKEIMFGKKVVARYITQDDIKDGLNFYSKEEEYIQVGAWKYERGKELQAHIHNQVERSIDRTNEVLYVISGSVEAVIYNMEQDEIDRLVINQGEILVLLECGHGYKILADDTKVLEIKNGPYLGAEKDRKRI